MGRVAHQSIINEPLIRQRIVGRLAVDQPGRDAVGGQARDGPVAESLAFFVVRPNYEILQRPPRGGDEVAFVFEFRLILLEALIVVQRRYTQREFILQENLVVVQGLSERSIVVGAQVEFTKGTIGHRAVDGGIRNTAGAAQTKQGGVGSAVDGHLGRDVSVQGDVAEKVIPRQVEPGEATHPGGELRLAAGELVALRLRVQAIEGGVSPEPPHLGGGGVDEQIPVASGPRVFEEFLGHDLDGIRHIFQFGVDAGARQGVVG